MVPAFALGRRSFSEGGQGFGGQARTVISVGKTRHKLCNEVAIKTFVNTRDTINLL